LGKAGKDDWGKSTFALIGFSIVIPSTYQAKFDGSIAQIRDDAVRDGGGIGVDRGQFERGRTDWQMLWRLARLAAKPLMPNLAIALAALRPLLSVLAR
jgi:hypothetical protein